MDKETKKVFAWIFVGFMFSQSLAPSETTEDIWEWVTDRIE